MNNAKGISMSEARRRLGRLVDQVAQSKKSFVITKFGNPKAMLVPILEKSNEMP